METRRGDYDERQQDRWQDAGDDRGQSRYGGQRGGFDRGRSEFQWRRGEYMGSPAEGGFDRGRRVWDPESGMYNQSPGYGRSTPAGRGYGFRDDDFFDETGGSSYEGWGRGGYGQYGSGTFGQGGSDRSDFGGRGTYGPSSRFSEGFASGPYTGKGPRGYRRSDDRIREDVSEELMQHGWIDASDIEVMVAGGEVTLKGTVDDRSQKRLAEDVAESVSGVRDVHNELKLKHLQGGGSPRDLKHDPATTAGQPASGAARSENPENNRTTATAQR